MLSRLVGLCLLNLPCADHESGSNRESIVLFKALEIENRAMVALANRVAANLDHCSYWQLPIGQKVEALRFLADHSPDGVALLSKATTDGMTPAHRAAQNDHVEALRDTCAGLH